MNIGNKAIIAAIAGAVFALGAGSALAASGHATGNVNVRTGPGTGYAKVDTLYRGEQIQIGECRSGWCYVTHSGPDGWASGNYLSANGGFGVGNGYSGGSSGGNGDPSVGFSFGFGSNGAQFGFSFGNQGSSNWPQRETQPRACFYSGNNYSGQTVCVNSGQSLSSIGNWNDKVSSVRLYNGASVTMCQHVGFNGFCRTSSNNEPALGPWLNNKISSVRVH